jgi:hypothetical protein
MPQQSGLKYSRAPRFSGKLVILILFIGLGYPCERGFASQTPDPLSEKASHIFGEPLDKEHFYYPLDNDHVVWLIEDTDGRLIQIGVGPKSDHVLAFSQGHRPANPKVLSDAEYNNAIAKVSMIQDVGRLLQRHGRAHPGKWGPMNTDRYQGAFVDRVVSPGSDDAVKSFEVYFVRVVSDSPQQTLDTQDGPMICLEDKWYYALSDSLQQMKMGDWQNRLVVAGPNLHDERCVGPRIWHDAEGFTIEGDGPNHTVLLTDTNTVRTLSGHVSYAGIEPVAGVTVEFKRLSSGEILLTKTDEHGFFKIPHAPEGEYKLFLTKEGFCGIRGSVIVSHRAKMKNLTFILQLGT